MNETRRDTVLGTLMFLATMIAVVAATVAVFVAARVQSTQNEIRVQEHRLDLSERAVCDRVNTTRVRVNAGFAVSYMILVLSAKTNVPGAATLRTTARSLRWQGLTDCDKAVGHPDVYKQAPLLPYTPRQAAYWIRYQNERL